MGQAETAAPVLRQRQGKRKKHKRQRQGKIGQRKRKKIKDKDKTYDPNTGKASKYTRKMFTAENNKTETLKK